MYIRLVPNLLCIIFVWGFSHLARLERLFLEPTAFHPLVWFIYEHGNCALTLPKKKKKIK